MTKFRVLVLAAMLASIAFGLSAGPAEATGWSNCNWWADTPWKTDAGHLATATGFACSTVGNRIVQTEIYRVVDWSFDQKIQSSSMTFNNRGSGQYLTFDFDCEPTSYSYNFKSRSRLKDPSTGKASSWHDSGTRSLKFHNC